ncbi:hypothetical protein KZ829_16045 [Actinoplanes hulinensis]|uniref:Uncharacterized protein n=1 Tax=Actinoplanes hulinensis TaxID=1144547 RepID=A0ABS7B2J2_9ACTN|nr:hypothetical protein [Actinoplanes hulinensis]MBW6435250.1 hypothetical protein [Actinoplanes hulinensis]
MIALGYAMRGELTELDEQLSLRCCMSVVASSMTSVLHISFDPELA